ncbi:MAG: hypothetical protein JXA44_12255 [Methanospirillaceae archaeon]|nr:hypothetical protein [Methanospirillaceae archaeon]
MANPILYFSGHDLHHDPGIFCLTPGSEYCPGTVFRPLIAKMWLLKQEIIAIGIIIHYLFLKREIADR